MSLHFHPLRVKSVRAETEEAVVVSFDVPEDLAEQFHFTHGQHLTLRHTIGGNEERRSYSICAAPADGELRVGIRKVPGG
ncbi:MAG TPA: FAD-binding oxidoreductase, partial [Caldimonas sp.]